MTWYSTGTVAVTNGVATLTGTGTAWVSNALAGMGVILPDGRMYEVAAVVSDTEITLGRGYLGATASGQAYEVVPTRGPEISRWTLVQHLLSDYAAVLTGAGAGRFGDGSLAQPGLRFATDEDTGFYRPADNQIGAVAGGVRRWLLTSAAMQIDVPVTGTAVTQTATDTTAGRLLKVGDSATILAAGFETRTTSGGTANAITLTTNAGLSGAPETGLKLRFMAALTNTGAATIALDGGSAYPVVTVTGVALPAGYIRTDAETVVMFDGTSWVAGREMESKTNANGRYERFANGLMICTHVIVTNVAISLASGTLGYRCDPFLSWTFPSAFVTVPVVPMPGTAVLVTVAGVQMSQVSFFLGSFSSQGATNRNVYLEAKGRWY